MEYDAGGWVMENGEVAGETESCRPNRINNILIFVLCFHKLQVAIHKKLQFVLNNE